MRRNILFIAFGLLAASCSPGEPPTVQPLPPSDQYVFLWGDISRVDPDEGFVSVGTVQEQSAPHAPIVADGVVYAVVGEIGDPLNLWRVEPTAPPDAPAGGAIEPRATKIADHVSMVAANATGNQVAYVQYEGTADQHAASGVLVVLEARTSGVLASLPLAEPASLVGFLDAVHVLVTGGDGAHVWSATVNLSNGSETRLPEDFTTGYTTHASSGRAVVGVGDSGCWTVIDPLEPPDLSKEDDWPIRCPEPGRLPVEFSPLGDLLLVVEDAIVGSDSSLPEAQAVFIAANTLDEVDREALGTFRAVYDVAWQVVEDGRNTRSVLSVLAHDTTGKITQTVCETSAAPSPGCRVAATTQEVYPVLESGEGAAWLITGS